MSDAQSQPQAWWHYGVRAPASRAVRLTLLALPCQRYRNHVISALKNIKSLDFATVTKKEREAADRWRQSHRKGVRKVA